MTIYNGYPGVEVSGQPLYFCVWRKANGAEAVPAAPAQASVEGR